MKSKYESAFGALFQTPLGSLQLSPTAPHSPTPY